jgi:hypothetical protein
LVSPVAADSKKTGASPEKRKKVQSAGRKAAGKERDVGNALRSIYQKTVDESVPREMLDLLGKLD